MCFIVRGFALIKLNGDQWFSAAVLQASESGVKVTSLSGGSSLVVIKT